LRVDADHFTVHVEQRPAGVAGIDRHIGLDERHEIVLRQRAPLGADDARRHAAVEAERRADGDHPFAHLEFIRVADGDFRQAGRFDFQQGHIGALVRADDLGAELALVGQAHGNLFGAVHHMRIGHDVTIRTDDKTRAQ